MSGRTTRMPESVPAVCFLIAGGSKIFIIVIFNTSFVSNLKGLQITVKTSFGDMV